MTRADWLLLVIGNEIQRRRDQINGDATIDEVVIAVELPRNGRHSGSIKFKIDGQRVPLPPIEKS